MAWPPSVAFPIVWTNWKAGREGAPPYHRWELPSSYPVLKVIVA
jgi:hypothetical protein